MSFIRVCCLAVLCAISVATPAAADDGPQDTLVPRILPLRPFVAAQSGQDAAPTTTPVPRAAPAARSYPRTFDSYEALIDYAQSVAASHKESDDRLAAVRARQDAAVATLDSVFDPRARGGLLRSRADLIDDATLNTLRTQFANDAATRRQLEASGATVTPATSWCLPVLGEDTQDFGPTPYLFEPAKTYRGAYYPHFHDGTDIAVPWGTPVLAPAPGRVVFAGTMGDGAVVVVIAHEAGLVSMYAHLEDRVFPLPVKAGDAVEAGERIGNVGLTGITTGTHLHWSVWRNGELIDPLSTNRELVETGETAHHGPYPTGRRTSPDVVK